MKDFEPEFERIRNAHRAEKQIIQEQHEQALEALRAHHASELRSALQEAETKATHSLLAALENERTLYRKRDAENFSNFLKQLEEERERSRKKLEEKDAEIAMRSSATEELEQQMRQAIEAREEGRTLLDRVAQQQKNDSAAIVRLEEELEEVSVKLSEESKRCAELQAEVKCKQLLITQLEAHNSSIQERIEKLEAELDNAGIEKISLSEQLKVAENSLELFKSTELARIEASVQRLVDNKNREIEELMDRVREFELRRQT
jgi:chromosome segregation ATPase